MTGGAPAVAVRQGLHVALGGGGLVHWLVRLFIWHEIFRLFRYLWRIPTFGPFIVVILGLILVGIIVWRTSRNNRSTRGTSGPPPGSGSGPRDW